MDVVISDADDPWALKWGEQYAAHAPKQRVNIRLKAKTSISATRAATWKVYQNAAQIARHDGMIIINVGHGFADAERKVFLADLAPKAHVRLNQIVMDFSDHARHVERLAHAAVLGKKTCGKLIAKFDAFVHPRPGKDPKPLTRQETSNALDCAAARDPEGLNVTTVRNLYLKIADVMRQKQVGYVVFLTCRVGNAVTFVQQLANDWRTSVVAFKRRVMYVPDETGQIRMYLEGDEEGQETNTERARTELPITDDMLETNDIPRPFNFGRPFKPSVEPYAFHSDSLLICSGRPAGIRPTNAA